MDTYTQVFARSTCAIALGVAATACRAQPADVQPDATPLPITAADLTAYTPGGAAAVKPVVVNPDFENGAEGWPPKPGYRVDPTGGRDGGAALFCERTDPSLYQLPGQPLKLVPGTRYRFGAWVRTENVAGGQFGGATVCIEYTKGGKWLTGQYPGGIEGTKDWTRVESVTTVPADADSCTLVLYLRPKATGKAWFDDVTVEPEPPRWVAYMIRPSRETVSPTDGRVLLGSCVEGILCPPPESIRDEDLACRVQALAGGNVARDLVVAARGNRIAVDVGKLPAGPASLKLTLLDTRHRWVLVEQELPITVAAPSAALPANACTVDAHDRTVVNGKPFLPVGLYHHAFTTPEDLELIAHSPFNCIMPYNSLYLHFKDSPKTGLDAIREVLDACQARGLKVIFSIKDVYAGTKYAAVKALGVDGEAAVVEKAVTAFRDHPALLAWYINDELPTTMLDRLTARRREVNRLDPFHPTWAVFCSFADLPVYGPTCDVVGVDPYPIRNAESRDQRTVRYSMEMCQRAVGTPDGMATWAVPQIMNWACYDAAAKKDRAVYEKNFRDPTEPEMRAMSLLCAIMGAKGFVYYSYSDLTGVISPMAKPDFARRWPEVCRMAETVIDLAPFLLSDRAGPTMTLTVEAGVVEARAFADGQGGVRVLVAGIGPGESRALITVADTPPLHSTGGNTTPLAAGQYRFHGQDICADVLASE